MSDSESQVDPVRRHLVVLATTFPTVLGDETPSFVLDLSSQLGKHYRTTVITPRVGCSARVEQIGDIEVRRFPYFFHRWETLADGAIVPNIRNRPWLALQAPLLVSAMLFQAWRQVRMGRALVHAHWVLPSGVVAAVLKWLKRTPFIVTAHGGDAFALRGSFWSALRGAVLRSADAALPVSSDVAHALGIRGAPVIPMGTDWDSVRTIAKRRHPGVGSFVVVGRLVAKKGVDVAIRAVAGTGNFTLTIVGDGPERRRLEALIEELGVRERITLTGALPKAKVLRQIVNAGALIIPSVEGHDRDRDGTPVVLAEAVALSVPVIASDIGGLGDLLDDETAVLVPPGDADALRSALVSTNQEALERRAAVAVRRLRSELDMRFIGERYLAVLNSL